MRILAPLTILLVGFHALAQTTPASPSSSNAPSASAAFTPTTSPPGVAGAPPSSSVGAPLSSSGPTALGALKLLPKDQAAKLVSIVAREGVPAPGRWYFLSFDPNSDNGVHECVVAGNRLVASRGLSQFAESLKAEDVLTSGSLQCDSDLASQIAFNYARANNVTIDSINYELKREDSEGVWKLICLNQSGVRLGELKISAEKGTVVSHEGFAVEPGQSSQTVSKELADADAAALSAKPEATPKPKPKSTPKPQQRETNPAKAIGNTLKHLFGGH